MSSRTFLRSTRWALTVFALTFVFTSVAPASPAGHDRTPPTTPTNLRITATSPTSVSLAWNRATDNSSSWWYIVQGCGGSIRVNPPTTTFTNSRLLPDRTYTCHVYAIDAAGNRSGNSNTVSYTTPPDTTPPSPAPALSATAVHPRRITVAWTAAADNVSQVFYTLLVDGEVHFADQIGRLSATVDDLTPSSTYVFTVRARDAVGNTVVSQPLSVTTRAADDTVPPSTPTNLSLSSESTPPEIWLDWNQSTDNADAQSEIEYEVYINGELDHSAFGTGETITYCRPEGVPNTIAIRALDTSGNASGFSNEIVFNC